MWRVIVCVRRQTDISQQLSHSRHPPRLIPRKHDSHANRSVEPSGHGAADDGRRCHHFDRDEQHRRRLKGPAEQPLEPIKTAGVGRSRRKVVVSQGGVNSSRRHMSCRRHPSEQSLIEEKKDVMNQKCQSQRQCMLPCSLRSDFQLRHRIPVHVRRAQYRCEYANAC